MHYDMKQSGARIRFFRKQNRCTQEELAKLLSMDRSFLSGIESGKKGCSVDLLYSLPSSSIYLLMNLSLERNTTEMSAKRKSKIVYLH